MIDKKARNQKRAILFSMFVITALSLVVLSFKIQTEFKEEKRAEMFGRKVEQITTYLDDVKADLDKAVYTSSIRAFKGAYEYISATNESIDIDTNLTELILSGKIHGQKTSATDYAMFEDWMINVQALSKRMNINFTFKDIIINLSSAGPFLVNVSVRSRIIIADYDGVIGWNFTFTKDAIVDISDENISDPLYHLGSYANNPTATPLTNVIRKTNYTYFWSGLSGAPDTSNLVNHVQEQMYNSNPEAPSYLMRLEGETDCTDPDFTAECQKGGIESFVDVITSVDWDYSFKDPALPTCAADYQFFFEQCPEESMLKGGTGLNFYVGGIQMQIYNLTPINQT